MATATMIPRQRRQHKMKVSGKIEQDAKTQGLSLQWNLISFVACGLENGKQLQLWDSNLHKNTVWGGLFASIFWAVLQVSRLDLYVYGVYS